MRLSLLILAILIVIDWTIFNLAHARAGDDNFNLNHNHNKNYSQSYSQGGTASAINEGVTVSGSRYTSEDSFYSFATGFPQAHGCFGGAQGGASGSSGSSGFFGMHFINRDCWTAALAGAQANIEVKARLNCGGKTFREAIAFDQKKNKQAWCVGFMIEKYRAELATANAQVESAVEIGTLTPMTEELIIAANVTEEEFEELQQQVEDKNAQQQNQIEELERRTAEAEQRAAEAEAQLRKLQAAEQVKKKKLLQLQQELRTEYESPESQ